MKPVAALVIAAALLVAALPAFSAGIPDELAAAQACIKADKLADASAHLQAALDLAAKAGQDQLTAADLLALADVYRYQMALAYDTAIKSGKLDAAQLKQAKKARREILGIRNLKIIGMGQEVDLSKELVAGKTCIVDFFSIYCPPCMALAPYIEALADGRDDLYVIKVDINRPDHKGIDWQSPTAREFKLQSIPHIKIFGPDGSLQSEGDAARTKLIEMIQAAGEL